MASGNLARGRSPAVGPDDADATAAETEGGHDPVSLGFEQVNTEAAELLRAYVLGESGEPDEVVDAYCGTGAYGRPLAERGASVVGIELDPDAGAEARRNPVASFSVQTGPVETLLPDVLPTELLILNPPRTGIGSDVCDVVLASPPARIVYVSCDPATLARDLAKLTERFEISAMKCFDLFPQTAHVETVVTMNLRTDE